MCGMNGRTSLQTESNSGNLAPQSWYPTEDTGRACHVPAQAELGRTHAGKKTDRLAEKGSEKITEAKVSFF